MAVVKIDNSGVRIKQSFIGLASDTKPTTDEYGNPLGVGSAFLVKDGLGNITDTYLWDGTEWNKF